MIAGLEEMEKRREDLRTSLLLISSYPIAPMGIESKIANLQRQSELMITQLDCMVALILKLAAQSEKQQKEIDVLRDWKDMNTGDGR